MAQTETGERLMYYFCTYFDHRYLPRGLALYRSLKQHCSGFKLWVLCLNSTCYDILSQLNLPDIYLISLEDFEQNDDELLIAKQNRTLIEYYFTCTPSLPLYILNKCAEVDLITYLDADLYFFSNPERLYKEIGDNSIAIIEHRFSQKNEHLIKYGIYNVGWLSFRRDEYGLSCLRWYREQCLEWCYDRVEENRFADQKYLDDWTTRFENVVVLEHKGANVASWNIDKYKINGHKNQVWIDEQLLIFYHFHSFDKNKPWAYYLNPGFQCKRASDHVIMRDIFGPYIRELADITEQVSPLFPQVSLRSSIRGTAITSANEIGQLGQGKLGGTEGFLLAHEKSEQLLVKKLVLPGMTVFDVGAHIGSYSILLSKLVGTTGRVFSFEPTPSTFRKLKHNLYAYDCCNINAFQKVVFSENKQMEMNLFPDEYSSWNSLGKPQMLDPNTLSNYVPLVNTAKVEAITLDSFCQDNNIEFIDFLKVDVEGAESDVLKGTLELLKKKLIRCIQFEISKKMLEGMSRQAKETFDILIENGYECHQITKSGEIGQIVTDSDSFYENYIAFPTNSELSKAVAQTNQYLVKYENKSLPSPLRIIIGSAVVHQANWISTDIDTLNILNQHDWEKMFHKSSLDAILAEHVWEHLTRDEGIIAAENCYQYLKKGGYIRVAVPDGNHPDPEYISAVKPGGIVGGDQEHKILYNYFSLKEVFETAGFHVEMLEYFDEKGEFHFKNWNPSDGIIHRSKRFDERNIDNRLNFTSIIIDAIKIN
ncbi:FkbM family methyltransferase [Aetokthonos hydrillicola Thurmond2011]|uniref:FkbM family methyltransferase n=1 Tax=Aetokthonos hydrillicola Thurmond2011 TaxID=2712845 RepID=A0AAP5I781_9CYAN|nr:FkbM family methyltransferase [Aetokthonos hydrillicola]MDR9894882.1 FkbM family methyltransferase [Aetokthonos hydrillicola Thurmond2011]